MNAAIAVPGNMADTFLVHFFGTGLARRSPPRERARRPVASRPAASPETPAPRASRPIRAPPREDVARRGRHRRPQQLHQGPALQTGQRSAASGRAQPPCPRAPPGPSSSTDGSPTPGTCPARRPRGSRTSAPSSRPRRDRRAAASHAGRPVARVGEVPREVLTHHTLVLGETGSAKTASCILAVVAAMARAPREVRGAALIIDPKLELARSLGVLAPGRVHRVVAHETVLNLMAGLRWCLEDDLGAGRWLSAATRIPVPGRIARGVESCPGADGA